MTVDSGEAGTRREDSDRNVGCDFVPQLRQAGSVREESTFAATVSPAAFVYGVHGSGKREYFPGDASDRQEVQRGGNQLGTGGGEDPNVFALGLVAAPVYGSRAGDLVS